MMEQISLDLDEEMIKQLEAVAEQKGFGATRAAVIRHAINEFLKKEVDKK